MEVNGFQEDDVVVIPPPSSDNTKVQYVKKSSSVTWSSRICRGLSYLGLDYTWDCQGVTWPLLAANQTLALLCVAGPQRGKSTGQFCFCHGKVLIISTP